MLVDSARAVHPSQRCACACACACAACLPPHLGGEALRRLHLVDAAGDWAKAVQAALQARRLQNPQVPFQQAVAAALLAPRVQPPVCGRQMACNQQGRRAGHQVARLASIGSRWERRSLRSKAGRRSQPGSRRTDSPRRKDGGWNSPACSTSQTSRSAQGLSKLVSEHSTRSASAPEVACE